MRLLLLTAGATLLDQVLPRLEREGHQIDRCVDGTSTPAAVAALGVHLVLLDTGRLPAAELLPYCRALREDTDALLLLLSRVQFGPAEHRRLREAGADELLTQPVHADELLGSIHALLRRHRLASLEGGGVIPPVTAVLVLDVAGQRLVGNGREVALSRQEFRLLSYFLRRPGLALDRETLLAAVWRASYAGATKEVDLYVHYLRRKLEPAPARPRYLLTVWGRGYRYQPPAAGGR